MKERRTHQRIVAECYAELLRSDNPEKVFARYGRKTGEEALHMLHEKKAEEMGMTMWEYVKWLNED